MASIISGLPVGSGMLPFFRIEVQSTGTYAPVHQNAMDSHHTE
jgi:hypothetical protein